MLTASFPPQRKAKNKTGNKSVLYSSVTGTKIEELRARLNRFRSFFMHIRAVLSRFLLYLISSDLPIHKVNR